MHDTLSVFALGVCGNHLVELLRFQLRQGQATKQIESEG